MQYFIMIEDTKNFDSVKAKESNDLLDGIKRYLRIEHQHDDNKLLDYIRKHARLYQEE
jgi:hypothetical protein